MGSGSQILSRQDRFFQLITVLRPLLISTVLTVYSVSGIHLPRLTSPGTMIAMATGIAGGLALIFFQAAIMNGSISIVVPVTGLYPIIPAIYGIALLGEDITPVKIAGILMAIIAAILLSL
ncbi:MAG: EamA family transporter [Candidatus Aegiribacteria sp.]|nr:EamA family transporter [Candidatus Aegiribacteria sp.]